MPKAGEFLPFSSCWCATQTRVVVLFEVCFVGLPLHGLMANRVQIAKGEPPGVEGRIPATPGHRPHTTTA